MSTNPDLDRIAQTFENGTVLISGGSGFLGKVLIEKLLRVTDVKKIYLLLRTKKGKSPQQRVSDIFGNVLFKVLKEEKPSALRKVDIIPGDVSEIDLGISAENRKMLRNEVEFVYHAAASTRFDDGITRAVKINTRGTKYMLDLAKQCKNLKVFVHVSSAYAHHKERILYEKVYEPPADPEMILNSIDFNKEDSCDLGIQRLLGDCPNTYTFSKALAEGLVVKEMDNLPIIITRPSIIVPTMFQPITGWCNNLQGPMGLFVGAGKGIIRTMHIKPDTYADFLPCDLVANGLVVAVWYYLKYDKSMNVFNVTCSPDHIVPWNEMIETGKDIIYNIMPFNGVVWYPGGTMTSSHLVHTIKFHLFQIVPAIFIDLLLFLLGYKPLLYNIQRRIEKGSEMFDYYTMKVWNFCNANRFKPWNVMNETERRLYPIDVPDFDLKKYLIDCLHGVRLYNLHESDESIPAAKRHMKVMWFVDKICKFIILMLICWYIFKWILEPFIMGKARL